eukprot:comp16897_c0_seq1/m.15418 comp16897_c0_seq1/g.15418  ORF comp16897_c0_seq1/g.15418 comp16897_c0_seq1/m.15418 type:complete len:226 (-) comp16897_c0_seq1:722-1399(-)
MAQLDQDDMRELTLSISKLPDAELEELKSLIKKLQPEYKSTGIDLNALTEDTILQVQQFVRTTLIEYKQIRILITDSPKDFNLPYYLATYERYGVTDVVRTCDAEYQTGPLTEAGIKFWDWRFEDGDVASNDIIDDWLDLVNEVYMKPKQGEDKQRMIAVHCAAGLGRAPFLVALALIQAGMDNYDCVKYIREVRRGAINKRQLDYILKFKPRKKSVFKRMFKLL